nr:uncharacterized protein At4g37920-like [Arachis hypogaea]
MVKPFKKLDHDYTRFLGFKQSNCGGINSSSKASINVANRCTSETEKYIKQNTDVTLCALEIGKQPYQESAAKGARLSQNQNFEDFTGEFFRYLNLIADTLNGLEDRDAIARFGTRCLSAVSVHDNTLENVETLDDAQAKFDDILDSPSIDIMTPYWSETNLKQANILCKTERPKYNETSGKQQGTLSSYCDNGKRNKTKSVRVPPKEG